MKAKFLLSFLPLLIAAPLCRADTVTVLSSAGVFLDGVAGNQDVNNMQDSNNGLLETLVAGALNAAAGGASRRILYKFDLTAQIPSNAIVTAASVNVTVVPNFPPSPQASTFDLRRLLEDWTESEATWNSRMVTPVIVPWETPGAIGALDSVSTASSTIAVGTGSVQQTYTFASTTQLVADVQAWVANPGTNFGWLLISEGEAVLETARHFTCGRFSDTNVVPMLMVTFTASSPPIPPTISAVTLTNGMIQFSFNAESNRTYAIEASGAAGSGYTQITNYPAQPSARNVVFSEPVVASSNRFYRVRTP